MRYSLILSALIALVALACGGGEKAPQAPTATPTTAATEVQMPEPQSLIPDGYVLDQTFEVSLDGTDTGQIVVLSHTVAKDKIGQPVAATVPAECPDNSVLGGRPSPCAFRVEIFAYDLASGWASRYLEDDTQGGQPSAAFTQAIEARSWRLDVGGREALILTRVSCFAAHCPVELHEVLTMPDSDVAVAYQAYQASLELGPTSATFNIAAYAEFSGGCCPNGRLIHTVGLDPATGEVGVIDAELELFCTEGTFRPFSDMQPDVLYVRCTEDRPASGFEVTDETVVEPASFGSISGLQEGDRVSVEFIIKECPDSLLDCDPSTNSVTPVATKITVLNP